MSAGKWTRKNLKKRREVGYPGEKKTLKLKRWEKGRTGMKANRFNRCSRLRFIVRGVFVAVTLVSLSACAYPIIKQSSIKPDDVTDFVDKNYDNFIITYCGGKESPTAIRFDPKNDDVTLTGEGWYPVESKAQVDDMIHVMIDRYRFYNGVYSGPYLFEIQTKEGRVIGYYYSILDDLTLRQDGNNYRLSPITELDIREARKNITIRGAGG
jgi:hypothetical protein